MFGLLYIACPCLLLQLLNFSEASPIPEANCENNQNPSELNSFLWTLKRNPPSYFFGTIHVPYTRVWNYIPQNTKTAFDEAEEIIFELDLTNPYTISALADCQLLPRGEKLDSILPPDLYQRLKRHIEYVKTMLPVWMTPDQRGKGLYADYLFNAIAGNWERKRPVWVMLMVNSLTENDIKSRGIPVLDLYLAQEAEKIGKVTNAVERVEEQCVPLNELNFSQVLFALNQTLWQHEISRSMKTEVRYTTEDLIHHYNCGDLNAIIFNHDTAQVPNLVNSSLPPQELETARLIDDYFREQLINKRNQRMTERVVNLLKAYPQKSFFFAFGAGHFLGNETIIDRLRAAGYEIEHTGPEVYIPMTERSKRKYRRRKISSDYSGSNFWLQMDAESRMWNDQKKSKKQKKSERRIKPFNDLWIKMDSYDANLMAELAEKYGYPERRKNKTQPQQSYHYQPYSKSTRPQWTLLTSIFILLLEILLWT